jgi:haloalkane dehalogenase
MVGKKFDTRRFAALYPFSPRFFRHRGHWYHYLDEGQGRPVLMIHGNPTWSFYFRELVKALSPDHRAIVPDHFGCGLSDSPDPAVYDYRLPSRVADLEALVAHLDIQEPITLIVHDWGGMIGTLFALRHPHRIQGLILLNTAGFLPPSNKRLPLRLHLIRNLAPFAVPAVLGLNLFARAALYMAPRKRLSPPVKAGLIAPYRSPRHRLATLRFVQDIPLKPGDPSHEPVKWADENLDQLAHLPMMVLWGMGDFVFDGDYLDEWARRFPNAEIHRFDRAGHYVLEDRPDEIALRVKQFLKKYSL